MNIQKQELYTTTDLALSAMISLYYPLDSVDWTEDPHKAKFLFKKDEQLDQLVASYWRGELRVNPQTYFTALKNIKAQLYATR